jgi:hypothetical protein
VFVVFSYKWITLFLNYVEILQRWDLFGSSFFSVKRMADPSPPEEYILALNKNGVHFLDIITHVRSIL